MIYYAKLEFKDYSSTYNYISTFKKIYSENCIVIPNRFNSNSKLLQVFERQFKFTFIERDLFINKFINSYNLFSSSILKTFSVLFKLFLTDKLIYSEYKAAIVIISLKLKKVINYINFDHMLIILFLTLNLFKI